MTRTSTKMWTTTVAKIARPSTDDLGMCMMTVVEDPYLYHFPNMNDYLHYKCPRTSTSSTLHRT